MEGLIEHNQSLYVLLGLGFGLQLIVALYVLLVLRSNSKEQSLLHRELYGLTKRIEGLTSSRREQVLRHFDRMVDNLATRLPTIIASRASEAIFEAESKILNRLARIEPTLQNDAESKAEMDALIKSMERLEQTIIALTANSVHQILMESRVQILEDAEPLPERRFALNQ